MNTLTSTTFFSEYEKTFLYCRTKIDISLHFVPPPPSSSMTKFCLLKIVPKANPFFVTYCFSNAFLCQGGEEAGFMKAMLWGGWVLFYCTHSICHKQSLSSCYHLLPYPPIFDKRFLDGDYMCHLWLLKHFICFKRYRRFTAHQFGQKWSLPQQLLLYNVSFWSPFFSPSLHFLSRQKDSEHILQKPLEIQTNITVEPMV